MWTPAEASALFSHSRRCVGMSAGEGNGSPGRDPGVIPDQEALGSGCIGGDKGAGNPGVTPVCTDPVCSARACCFGLRPRGSGTAGRENAWWAPGGAQLERDSDMILRRSDSDLDIHASGEQKGRDPASGGGGEPSGCTNESRQGGAEQAATVKDQAFIVR